MRLLGNLRWSLIIAITGLLLSTEAQGKPEGDDVKSIRQKAEAGDLQSQTWLGMMHYEGAGVSKNLDEAAKWIKKAAESGSAEAQYKLSEMYGNGEGVEKSDSEQLKWLIKAAESGHAIAQYNYGRRIGFNFGPRTRDLSKDAESAKWIQKSADQGYPLALVALANCFYFGHGVPESNEEAEKYFRKAADQDYKEAKIALGKMLIRNEAKSRSPEEYATLAKVAREASPKDLEIDDDGDIWVTGFDGIRTKCETDEAGTVLVPGWVQLKETYLERKSHKPNDKEKECVELSVQSWLNTGNDNLKLTRGFWYYHWRIRDNVLGWWMPLSPDNEPHGRLSSFPLPGVDRREDSEKTDFALNVNAQYAIAESLRFATTEHPNARPPYIAIPEIEVRWYKRASEYGHAEAQYQLALCYYEGRGVEKNLSLSAKWFLKSAEQGNIAAQCQVGYCYLLGRGLPRDEIEGYAYLNMASAKDESLRQDVRELEREMPVSARYAGQQRTRQLIKEIEDKKEAALRQSAESKKAREKKGA